MGYGSCRQGGFPDGSVVKNLPAKAGDAGDVGSIPGWGRSSGRGNDNPLQYSCLENPKDKAGLQSIGSQRVRLDLVTEHAGHRQEGYLIQRFLDIFEYRNFFLMGHHVRLMCYMVSDLLTHN